MQENDERFFFERLRLAICRAFCNDMSERYMRRRLEDIFLELEDCITDDQLLWLLVEAELPAQEYMYGTNPYMESRRRDPARWRLASIRERMNAQTQGRRPSPEACLESIEEVKRQRQREGVIESSRQVARGILGACFSRNPLLPDSDMQTQR